MSKMYGYTKDAVVHVAAAIVRILHLSAVLPTALRLKELEDDGSVVLHDGDEYVSAVVIETLGRGPTKKEEYIEAIKVETMEPIQEEIAQDKKPQDASDYMADTDESSEGEGTSATSSSCDSPLGSLEPDEEVVELSDEEDVPVPISKSEKAIADKLGDVPPCAINVVAFAEDRGYHDHKSGDHTPFAVVKETRSDMQPYTTTYKGTPYVPTTGGSMVIAPELAESESSSGGVELVKAGEQPALAKALDNDRFSDNASVETNATEATEDDRLRGLSESVEAVDNEDEDLARDKLESTSVDTTSKADESTEAPRNGELSGASSLSSMMSSSSEDDLSALRSEFGVPAFLPPIATTTAIAATTTADTAVL